MDNAMSPSIELKNDGTILLVRKSDGPWKIVRNVYMSVSTGNRDLTFLSTDGTQYNLIIPKY